MNFLAHAYLSFNEREILVGNMISDFVKGKKQYDFPAGIQKGIQLHRAIDAFTDSHPATKAARLFFQPGYRLYSGAFVDVVYDHFLAQDRSIFPGTDSLRHFSASVYDTLDHFSPFFPPSFARIYPYMRTQDWLFHYREEWLIEKSFMGLERRAVYLAETGVAFTIFREQLSAFREAYSYFFPELERFAIRKLQELLNG